MIERIIDFSIRNRLVVILAAAAMAVWGVHAVINTPVDAIPDLSEHQVVVFADWMGRSPREIEDQVTYPLSVNLQGLSGVKAVRSSSEFNFSMISVIFEDDVDFYFARQRVSERLGLAGVFLPAGVTPYLAPDATALGQIFWYTVEGDGQDLGRLRAIQDWYVRHQLNSVPGVAQVASVGGYPIEYQIDVDPNLLKAHGVTLGELSSAVARSNAAVGGRVIHQGNAEYLVRGVGWLRSLRDIEQTVVRADPQKGTALCVGDVAKVSRGTEFRRSVLEKDGSEAVGAVVMMRHGENPLEVTRRIKDKIEQLQPGLPEGVRIVPFYDRTRLIHGAIDTLTSTLVHEMVIASAAILLILMHVRSALVVCVTLPLSVLFSFILMRLFAIPSNIMSLAGIAISIGVLVDQAIVMVENATHRLSAQFGRGRPVVGDTRAIVSQACRTVGRPIFFSVLIILVSFLPVFALDGRDGKTFHPLAFTKTFAMIGVAVLSITLVPALIPTLLRGRLRREEESWLVRSLIDVYKPVLRWAMPRRNLVMWSFAALLICGAGLFPLDALLGMAWHRAFLIVVAVTMAGTLYFTARRRWQALSFVTLAALSLCAYNFPKIGKDYMPPLDEGSILDMPVTVPRVSVAQAADDLKARDAVLRGFPEVELIVGKAGRADTPTDPSPLDMVESVINLRPKEHWPKRKLDYKDAEKQAAAVLDALQRRNLVEPIESEDGRHALLDAATMAAVARTDGAVRDLLTARYRAFEEELGPALLREFAAELVRRWDQAERLLAPVGEADVDRLADGLSPEFARLLAAGAAQEDVNRLVSRVGRKLAEAGKVEFNPGLLTARYGALHEAWLSAMAALGKRRPTLCTDMHGFLQRRRDHAWRERARELDHEVFDYLVATFNWHAIEQIRAAAQDRGLCGEQPGEAAQRESIQAVRAELDAAWTPRLTQKHKTDLIQEMDAAMQMPGWANIWTQPIVNRIDMLATGVRTMVGVKVFGGDLEQIQTVSEQVAAVLREVPGATDVFPDQNVGKGYVEIQIDRQKAARHGLNVGDVQEAIEAAVGGKTLTTMVEGRQRFPVRIRLGRAWRDDVERIRNLMVDASGGGDFAPMGGAGGNAAGVGAAGGGMAASARPAPVQAPLWMVADVKIVEGPAMIKSENGMLRSYVQLNVRDRDLVGFVEEAQKAVAEKVSLPPGTYLEWSGQFENQLRMERKMALVFPAALALIFLILYLTYRDLTDAALMMMAVPEAMVGGVFLLWLFGHHYSAAVQVGFIACFGMATETGIIMLVYLREALARRGGLESIRSLAELRAAVLEGAAHRLRPKLLTECVAVLSLAPMLWATGVGHEVISVLAVPVIGGLLIADEVVDIFIPVRFYWVRRRRWLKLHGVPEAEAERVVLGPAHLTASVNGQRVAAAAPALELIVP